MRVIRHSETRHAAAIARLTAKVYGRADAYSAAQIRGQSNNFPEGQFLAEYEGQVVGFCATLIVPEAAARTDHRWTAISGGGFVTRHDPDGDILYGMEVCVDPDYRRLRIGQRFYRNRQERYQAHELQGNVLGRRMTGNARHPPTHPSPDGYL